MIVEDVMGYAAAAYPITSSTIMGQNYQVYVANGFKNAWGKAIGWLELESEHSSASACEGYALAGGRVVNFTSGQGLILMKEVLYTTSGKRLPVVLHVASRALTSQSLNVHAGHDLWPGAGGGMGVSRSANCSNTTAGRCAPNAVISAPRRA